MIFPKGKALLAIKAKVETITKVILTSRLSKIPRLAATVKRLTKAEGRTLTVKSLTTELSFRT